MAAMVRLVMDLRSENKKLQTTVSRLQKELNEFETPVPGQVPSDKFVCLQARARIAAAASRADDKRQFHAKSAKVVSVAEAEAEPARTCQVCQRAEDQASGLPGMPLLP